MAKRITNIIDLPSKAILYELVDGRKRISTTFARELGSKIDASFTAIIKRYDPLLSSGLIKQEIVGATKLISITEKGKKIVKVLKEIDKIMEE